MYMYKMDLVLNNLQLLIKPNQTKEKIKYFHNLWIKILLELFSLNYQWIFNNLTIE